MAGRFVAMNTAPTLSPRYYQAATPLRSLGSDIGPLGATSCCPDDTYCAIDPTGSKAVCCAIGSVCNSPCAESEYQCAVTVTVTAALPATTTTSSACCPRQCTQTSMFGCPSSLGGGCCSYGQTCASAGQCLWTSNRQSSSAASLVTQVPAGCTTKQIACPSSLGGGCCAATQSCTFVGSGPHCVAVTVVPTASGVVAAPQNRGPGLDTGEKAGIAVGAVVGIGLVVGLATWRVLRRSTWRAAEGSASGSRTLTVGTASSPTRRDGPPEMTSSTTDIPSPNGGLRGLTADYFGPIAVPGPFTESGAEAGLPDSLVTTPPGGNNRDRAVPREPHSPDDIAAPVEIDSGTRQRNVSETIAGRFELYGSERTSPYSEETTSPYDMVSPYSPSPGTMTDRHMLPSPTLGWSGDRSRLFP